MENSTHPSFGFQHQEHQNHHANHQPIPASPKQGRAVSRNTAYIFSAIALLTAASSLIVLLIVWVNGSSTKAGVSFESMAFPAAALIIALPVFAGFLLDLSRAELRNPQLKLSLYKKYSLQLLRIVAFITCFFTLIGLVFGIFVNAASPGSDWLGRLLLDVLIILAVAGGVLVYSITNSRKS